MPFLFCLVIFKKAVECLRVCASKPKLDNHRTKQKWKNNGNQTSTIEIRISKALDCLLSKDILAQLLFQCTIPVCNWIKCFAYIDWCPIQFGCARAKLCMSALRAVDVFLFRLFFLYSNPFFCIVSSNPCVRDFRVERHLTDIRKMPWFSFPLLWLAGQETWQQGAIWAGRTNGSFENGPD